MIYYSLRCLIKLFISCTVYEESHHMLLWSVCGSRLIHFIRNTTEITHLPCVYIVNKYTVNAKRTQIIKDKYKKTQQRNTVCQQDVKEVKVTKHHGQDDTLKGYFRFLFVCFSFPCLFCYRSRWSVVIFFHLTVQKYLLGLLEQIWFHTTYGTKFIYCIS